MRNRHSQCPRAARGDGVRGRELSFVQADARAKEPAACDGDVDHGSDDQKRELLRRDLFAQRKADESGGRRREEKRQEERAILTAPTQRVWSREERCGSHAAAILSPVRTAPFPSSGRSGRLRAKSIRR